MSTESLNEEIENQDAKVQPEETFDKHVASLINEFKGKLPSDMDTIIIVKPNESSPPIVFMRGHIYDIAVIAAEFVRELKNQIGQQLDC